MDPADKGQRRNGGMSASSWMPQLVLIRLPPTGCSALPFGDGVSEGVPLSVSALFDMKGRAPLLRLSLVDIECVMGVLHCRGQHTGARP
jgi:hypothetical protein